MNVERGFARQENTDINHETEDQMRDFDVDEFIKIVNMLDRGVDFSIKDIDTLNTSIIKGRKKVRELIRENDKILETSSVDRDLLGESKKIAEKLVKLLEKEW